MFLFHRTRLESALGGILDNLVWIPMSSANEEVEDVRISHLIGPSNVQAAFGTSNTINLGLIAVPRNSLIPLFGDDGDCFYHILQCDPGAKHGFTNDLEENLFIGKTVYYPPGSPRTFQASFTLTHVFCLHLNIRKQVS